MGLFLTPHTQYEFTYTGRFSDHIWRPVYCFLIYSLWEEAEDKTASCSLWQKIDLAVSVQLKDDWMHLSDFCSYSIHCFLLTKHYICSRVWAFFSLTWHCNRRIIPPSILLGNETERFFSFSAFLWLTWHWIRRMSFFLYFLLSVFLLEGKEGGEQEERRRGGGGGGQSYRVKHTDEEERGDNIKKIDLRDEKRHKGLHCWTSVLPFIITSISFLSQRGSHWVCLHALESLRQYCDSWNRHIKPVISLLSESTCRPKLCVWHVYLFMDIF